MIQVISLTISEFRGIRKLELDLARKNFAVCGPNGTGKSGVVDALEFALTGNVSRLSGAGTGGLSVGKHGPHVDCRNNPEKASVALKVFIPSMNKEATIVRTVKAPKKPTITPSTPAMQAVFDRLALHPEVTLSRRELIRYVLAEPGKRSEEVQGLLRLDEVEDTRKLLQKIANSCEKDRRTAELDRADASDDLRRALGLSKLSSADILKAANEKRVLLGLPTIAGLEATTSLKDGLVTVASSGDAQRIAKGPAKAILDGFKQKLEAFHVEEFKASCMTAKAAVDALAGDEKFLSSASRAEFLRNALKLFEDEKCPACDTPWDPQEFATHIAGKVQQFNTASQKRKEVEISLSSIVSALRILQVSAPEVVKLGGQLQPAIDCKALTDFTTDLKKASDAISAFLPITSTSAALAAIDSIPAEVIATLNALDTAVTVLPEPTQQDAAKEFLIIAQEKLNAYRKASGTLKKAEARASLSKTVVDTYGASTTNALNDIYQKVEGNFSALYSLINQDDEADFKAQLTPSLGKLGFDVDFYGRGFFPPGAYHSEGHQDGMGLCLYLALMKHLNGNGFTFAVLDDVLMSVDAGHRREVSKMLREQFPNTQFLLTTHDEIWLRHMRTVALVEPKRQAHFRKWTVDLGPTEWDDLDVWQEIDAHLESNDVRAAAALLRHYLEHFSKEVCHNLHAKVMFKGDAQYTLGELLPNACKRFKELLQKGVVAAKSWAQDDKASATEAKMKAFSTSLISSQIDQWQINAAVHYNEWATLHGNDFSPLVAAFKQLVTAFHCQKCQAILKVVPDHGSSELLSCSCGDCNINLKKK